MAKKKTKVESFTDDDDALLAELGVETEVKEDQTYTAKQERIIAGFEDIQRYYREHDSLPQHGEGRDIFERVYAVRLDRIRASSECLDLLRPIDTDGILADRVCEPSEEYELNSDDELLEALGVGPSNNDITTMKHVRSASERNAERNVPEEVAQRNHANTSMNFAWTLKPCKQILKQAARVLSYSKPAVDLKYARVIGSSSMARRHWLRKQVSGSLQSTENAIDAYELSSITVRNRICCYVRCEER